MLSLIIVSLVAGVCFGQDPSRFSDCETVNAIADQCGTSHLDYVKQLDAASTMKMKMLGDLDNPDTLVPRLDIICNDTMELKKYYMCVFVNLTTCLAEKNSTQMMSLPDSTRIAMGAVDLCKAREDMNKTCIMEAITETEVCFAKDVKKRGMEVSDPCSTTEDLITCASKLTECDGGEAVKDFIRSARPYLCKVLSSAPHYLPSFLVLLVAVLLAHYISIQ